MREFINYDPPVAFVNTTMMHHTKTRFKWDRWPHWPGGMCHKDTTDTNWPRMTWLAAFVSLLNRQCFYNAFSVNEYITFELELNGLLRVITKRVAVGRETLLGLGWPSFVTFNSCSVTHLHTLLSLSLSLGVVAVSFCFPGHQSNPSSSQHTCGFHRLFF